MSAASGAPWPTRVGAGPVCHLHSASRIFPPAGRSRLPFTNSATNWPVLLVRADTPPPAMAPQESSPPRASWNLWAIDPLSCTATGLSFGPSSTWTPPSTTLLLPVPGSAFSKRTWGSTPAGLCAMFARITPVRVLPRNEVRTTREAVSRSKAARITDPLADLRINCRTHTGPWLGRSV